MPDQARLHEMLAFTAFGGMGVALALAMIVAGFVLFPKDERVRLRLPFVILAAHVAVVLAEWILPEDPLIRRPVRVLAIALLLVSIGRSGFLLVANAMAGRRGSVPLPRIIQDILQAVIYAGVALIVLRAAGVEPGSLLTTSALLTAVIGLSLQETLGNLFAGLAIQAQRPFEVGDWIRLDAPNAESGQVVEINWRATRVLTMDNVEITVPNGALARASILNFSKPTPDVRRSATIVVSGDVPPGEVHRLFEEALRATPGVLEQPAPDVQTLAFNDRGVEYRVRYWTRDFERREVIDGAVRDRLWYALQRVGLGIPGAQRHVYVHETNRQARDEERAAMVSERERALHDVEFLRGLPEEALRALASSAERRIYGAGEIVIREGSEGDELFVVDSGEVEIVVTRVGGPVTRVGTVGPGRFFGEMSLMTGERRRATVRTLRETVLLVVGKKDLQPVLAAHPEAAERISEVLAEREVALGQVHARDPKDHKSIVEQRSDALLVRIRQFFSL